MLKSIFFVFCDRFDARELLERLRGKRMVFVGDSINRNQWVSVVCLLQYSIDTDHRSLTYNGSLMSFKAEVEKDCGS